MSYITDVLASLISTPLFWVFVIAAVGYLVGGVSIKKISLGTSGVLLMALVFGVIANQVGKFNFGGKEIELFNDSIKATYSTISSIGTSLFVTAVGLIAGPKFFRSFNKKFLAYLVMGVVIIGTGIGTMALLCKVMGISGGMAAGLLTGALTSTPGLSAAKEAFAGAGEEVVNQVTAGYGIAYIFGVLGVVFFVQLMPRFLKVDIDKERESFVAATQIAVPEPGKKVFLMDAQNFFAFMFTIAFGYIIGKIYIPGINFSLGTSGGTLVAGLIVGHFGHIGPIDCRINTKTLDFFRELGLMLFLIGAGVPGGVNFVKNVELKFFIAGVIMTLVPMIIGFLLAKFVFKLSIFNNLGSITGGMTSTPALGTLISVAGTSDVAAAYASTYPVALVMIVLLVKLAVLF